MRQNTFCDDQVLLLKGCPKLLGSPEGRRSPRERDGLVLRPGLGAKNIMFSLTGVLAVLYDLEQTS